MRALKTFFTFWAPDITYPDYSLAHPPGDDAPAVADLSFCSAPLWHTSYSAENCRNSRSSHLGLAPSTAATATVANYLYVIGNNISHVGDLV